MTSEISKIFIGRGIFRFADIVFSNPGRRVVLAIWSSYVMGVQLLCNTWDIVNKHRNIVQRRLITLKKDENPT